MAPTQGKISRSLRRKASRGSNPVYSLRVSQPLVKIFILLILIFAVGSAVNLSLRAYTAAGYAEQVPQKLSAGNWIAAVACAWSAVDNQPGNADYHSLLALALELRAAANGLNQLEFLVEAAEALDRALELNRLAGDHWLQRARVAEKIKKLRPLFTDSRLPQETPSAGECFRRAIALDPYNIYYLISAAAYYARGGNRVAAEAFFARAWQGYPIAVGRYYLAWKPRQEALDIVVERFWQQRLAAGGDDAQLIYWLGGLYEARGEYNSARKLYRQGLQTTQAAHFKRLIQRIISKSRAR